MFRGSAARSGIEDLRVRCSLQPVQPGESRDIQSFGHRRYLRNMDKYCAKTKKNLVHLGGRVHRYSFGFPFLNLQMPTNQIKDQRQRGWFESKSQPSARPRRETASLRQVSKMTRDPLHHSTLPFTILQVGQQILLLLMPSYFLLVPQKENDLELEQVTLKIKVMYICLGYAYCLALDQGNPFLK